MKNPRRYKTRLGPVAQLVERFIRIEEVESSSLFRSTSKLAWGFPLFTGFWYNSHVRK